MSLGSVSPSLAPPPRKRQAKLRGKGLTWSKNGVALNIQYGKGRKKRIYPLAWGQDPDKMKVKKRVLCVYDGQRRLCKDDMMLFADHEVRMPLGGGTGPHDTRYITDLDYETIRRAEAFHNATEEERGPWSLESELLEAQDIEALMMSGSPLSGA